MDTFSIISLIVGAVGIAATAYFGFENYRLTRSLRSLDWHDVVLASKDLSSSIRREFSPDLIYAPDPRGGIIAFLIRDGLGQLVPVVSGATFWKNDFDQFPAWEGFVVAETNKVRLLLPKIGEGERSPKVLIVDDLAMSGDGLEKMVAVFVDEFGCDPKNVKTCTLVASETAEKSGKAPDYFWKTAKSYDFLFPWGKAR